MGNFDFGKKIHGSLKILLVTFHNTDFLMDVSAVPRTVRTGIPRSLWGDVPSAQPMIETRLCFPLFCFVLFCFEGVFFGRQFVDRCS